MITLKAPKPTAAEAKSLKEKREPLVAALSDLAERDAKVDAETQLASTLKQIERIHEDLNTAQDIDRLPLWNALNNAHEAVAKILQRSYEELLDMIGTALSPFYPNFHEARFQARAAPAVNDLVRRLMMLNIMQYDSIERLVDAGNDTLRKIDAILSGGEIWRFDGAAQ